MLSKPHISSGDSEPEFNHICKNYVVWPLQLEWFMRKEKTAAVRTPAAERTLSCQKRKYYKTQKKAMTRPHRGGRCGCDHNEATTVTHLREHPHVLNDDPDPDESMCSETGRCPVRVENELHSKAVQTTYKRVVNCPSFVNAILQNNFTCWGLSGLSILQYLPQIHLSPQNHGLSL